MKNALKTVMAVLCLLLVTPIDLPADDSGAGPMTSSPATPILNQIVPRGLQRGTEKTLSFIGVRLFDTEEVFFYEDGFEVKSIEQVDGKQVRVTILAKEDCRIGEHVAQLRTASGVSDFRSFYVGVLPEVDEASTKSDPESIQKIEPGCTINGTIKAEDIDRYEFRASKGQRISVEVEAIRLGAMFDPWIALYDESGNELVAVDDHPLTRQDGHFSILAPDDGVYTVAIREASFGGNDNCLYRLHVGEFPRPTLVYPAGGKFGETRELTFLGLPDGPVKEQVSLPESAESRWSLFCSDDSGRSPSPLPFLMSNLDSVEEVEPNNNFHDQEALSLPIAIDGRIGKDDPLDVHRFSAKKGETWILDCHARRIGSPLDPVIHVFDTKNKKYLGGNDDFARKPDAQMRFKAPEDGEYYVRVKDHRSRNGDDFVYRLQIEKAVPKLTIGMRRNDRYSQRRQQIVVPRGNRFAFLMNATRSNFGGQIKLIADSLPPGVTMQCQPMAANMNFMPVVFSATDDAEIAGELIDLRATHVDESKNISGGYQMRADFALGQPNNSLYYACSVDRVALAVAEAVPFRLDVDPPRTPLLQDGSISVKVRIHRDEGYDQPIHLQFPFRSPGVGTKYQVKVPKGKSEFDYPLNANAKAQLGKWPFYVIGWGENKGQSWISTELSEIEIAPPRVKAQMAMTSVTQGDTAEMNCTLEQLVAFEGEATAELLGVPPNVKTNSPVKFDATSKSISFMIETSEKSPPGKHRPFVRVKIPHNDSFMVATAGRGKLVINKPQSGSAKVAAK